jgi:hypothetical protein
MCDTFSIRRVNSLPVSVQSLQDCHSCVKGAFSPNFIFFYERAQLAPYELTHVRPSPGDCARLAGHKWHARFESSEALAELPAVARTSSRGAAWMLRPRVSLALQRRSSANILTAWPVCGQRQVAQEPRAGRARAPWSCSPCWRPSRENRTVEGPARAGDDEISVRLYLSDITNQKETETRGATTNYPGTHTQIAKKVRSS